MGDRRHRGPHARGRSLRGVRDRRPRQRRGLGRRVAADGPLAAADLLREVCTERFGSVEQAVAARLALRYDGGPCFRAAHYQAEINFLGIARSPAYHYEPETNGCVEKFNQTLKEQVLWIEHFDTLEQLRARIRRFARDFNQHWLLERHGYRTGEIAELLDRSRPYAIRVLKTLQAVGVIRWVGKSPKDPRAHWELVRR